MKWFFDFLIVINGIPGKDESETYEDPGLYQDPGIYGDPGLYEDPGLRTLY